MSAVNDKEGRNITNFRDFIRKESCDSKESKMRKAHEEELRIREHACEMIKCVKKDIQDKAEKGEFNLIGGKHYVSRERFQLYCYYGWDITDMRLSNSVMELGEEWHDRSGGFPHIFVETLKEASWFTPCKKRIYITKQEAFFREIVESALEADGIKFAGGLAVSVNGELTKIEYDDEIVAEVRPGVQFQRFYDYKFWY